MNGNDQHDELFRSGPENGDQGVFLKKTDEDQGYLLNDMFGEIQP